MPDFNQVLRPTAYGFFDADPAFQAEANGIVPFVKRKLGDDVLSVELTQRMIWTCLEEATLEYSRWVQQLKIVSELVNVLGQPTGSTDLTNRYPQRSLDYLLRMADAYATAADVGGSYDATLGYINIKPGHQDYNIYTELYAAYAPGSFMRTTDPILVTDTLGAGFKGKLRVVEVYHFEPIAAQSFLLNASNVTNFLATNFNYESYVNSTVFYVLPVFEDVVRRGMLKEAFRVRRSNYSYAIIGGNIRIFPIPMTDIDIGPCGGRLYIKVATPNGILDPDFEDDSSYGVSGPENVPFSLLPYGTITQPGRQWIRQYTLALAQELLGMVRSKFQVIPIPNADLQLNGETLITQAREDKDKLITQLEEFLDKLTNQALQAAQTDIAENMMKQLRMIPFPLGKAIIFG
jgi:hypothetical protein